MPLPSVLLMMVRNLRNGSFPGLYGCWPAVLQKVVGTLVATLMICGAEQQTKCEPGARAADTTARHWDDGRAR